MKKTAFLSVLLALILLAGCASEPVDVDLTKLSSTFVYSEVYNMVTNPGDYIGKTVKMKGMYSVYHDESTDKYYFACIIKDATLRNARLLR